MFQKYITLEQTLHQSSLPDLSTKQKQKRKYLTLICPKNLKQSKLNKEKKFEIQKEWKLWVNIYYNGFIGWYIGKYVLQKTIELIK